MPILYLNSDNSHFLADLLMGKKPSYEVLEQRVKALEKEAATRIAAENALRKSEERYRALFENNPIETIIVDHEARITGYNLAKKLSGDRLPITGDIMYRDYAAKHLHDLYSELMECIRTGEPREFPDQNYADRYLYIKISPYSAGAIITSIDMTRQKRLEERLRRLSYLDDLTGIGNRRYFEENFEREWKRAARSKTPLSLIMCDIDFFKAFNDTNGHLLGDESLKKVAVTLKTSLKRPGDIVARYGGEEFIELLPDTDSAEAHAIAEKQRMSVQQLRISHVQSTICNHLTISMGVATAIPSSKVSLTDLLSDCDRALYRAKQKGRNCTHVGVMTAPSYHPLKACS